jgi:GNAT superfamily N-acetyltransferase
MITFRKIEKELIEVVSEIINSNPDYNTMESSTPTRSLEEISEEYFDGNSEIYFILLDETYIGILDYLEHNPIDGFPWLGLLMIHRDYKGYGFGTNAYFTFEEKLREKGIKQLRLGVLLENQSAKTFWKSTGFTYIENKLSTNGNEVEVYEKQL